MIFVRVDIVIVQDWLHSSFSCAWARASIRRFRAIVRTAARRSTRPVPASLSTRSTRNRARPGARTQHAPMATAVRAPATATAICGCFNLLNTV